MAKMRTIMLMVCSNCKSQEVIKVQDQWFCTACGTTLPTAAELATSPEVQPPSVEATDLPAGVKVTPEMAAAIPAITNHDRSSVVASIVPKTKKKRGPGRPKATRLDVPLAASVPDSAATPEVVVAPVLKISSQKLEREVTSTGSATEDISIESVAPASMAVPVAPAIAETKPKQIAPNQNRQPMSDIRPRKLYSTNVPNESSEAKNISTKPKQPIIHHPPLDYSSVEADSWRGRFRPWYVIAAWVPAAILALLTAGITAVLINPGPVTAWTLTLQNGWAVGGEIALILALFYVSHTLAGSAVTFAFAREADHRPAPRSRWWGVAVNSFGAHLRLDGLAYIFQLVVVVLAAVLVVTGGMVWPTPEMVQIGALLVAFMVLLYLLVGLSLAQRLGRVGITLGMITARRGMWLGWDFFRHHFDLVGARIIGLALDLVIFVPFVAVATAVVLYAPSNQIWWISVILAVGVFVCGALAGAGGAIWWQSVYRKLVRNERITEAVGLLTGRQAERPSRWALVGVTALIVVLVVAIVVWPWLPLPKL